MRLSWTGSILVVALLFAGCLFPSGLSKHDRALLDEVEKVPAPPGYTLRWVGFVGAYPKTAGAYHAFPPGTDVLALLNESMNVTRAAGYRVGAPNTDWPCMGGSTPPCTTFNLNPPADQRKNMFSQVEVGSNESLSYMGLGDQLEKRPVLVMYLIQA